MSPTRRDFIKTSAAAAAAASLAGAGPFDVGLAAQTVAASTADPFELMLANEALNAARTAGATYADVRIGRYRRQSIATRERQVGAVSDNES
jgi:TldD protein